MPVSETIAWTYFDSIDCELSIAFIKGSIANSCFDRVMTEQIAACMIRLDVSERNDVWQCHWRFSDSYHVYVGVHSGRVISLIGCTNNNRFFSFLSQQQDSH